MNRSRPVPSRRFSARCAAGRAPPRSEPGPRVHYGKAVHLLLHPLNQGVVDALVAEAVAGDHKPVGAKNGTAKSAVDIPVEPSLILQHLVVLAGEDLGFGGEVGAVFGLTGAVASSQQTVIRTKSPVHRAVQFENPNRIVVQRRRPPGPVASGDLLESVGELDPSGFEGALNDRVVVQRNYVQRALAAPSAAVTASCALGS